jgi:lipopolysaccharide export system protein LptA
MGQKKPATPPKKSIVNLVKSTSSTGGKDLIKVYNGTFKQDYSTLTSDSAYFYPQENSFDAFGHVDINQGDTVNIYSDKLNYNGNNKVAILTDNVKMVDKDATLTTNHLTYNTATRIAVYTDGGKLVNKDNTLLSKNGYYFAFTRDSYFRYNVSLKTPDALVKTDTMRYNTGTKISYFYGPTNIYGTKNEKDKDTLYTENGTYNTVNEQAAFGKNNLYKSGTKSLKGDSLFYDKLKGYGRAVKHVTFDDKEQKTTIKGNLATYFKDEERTVVTQDPYVIMISEQKDTTKTDSAARADSIAKVAADLRKSPEKNKNAITMAQLIKKTIPGKTDTLNATQKGLVLKADSAIKKIAAENKTADLIKKDDALKTDSVVNKLSTDKKTGDLIKIGKALGADSVIKKISTDNKNVKTKPASTNSTKKPAAQPKTQPVAVTGKKIKDTVIAAKDTSKLKRDSIYMSADTIETRILTYKDLKIYLEKQRLAHVRDTTSKSKKPKVKEKESKYLTATYIKLKADTSFYHSDYFGKPKPKPVVKKVAKPLTKKQLAADSLRKKFQVDSIATAKKLEPSDTARIRIIIGHHHFKMFKSDLQAKADSMFYSNSDSTMRCYVNPIMWTQGSQLTGDTIYLQMKHKKLDNLTTFPNAFIVNIEKTDSLHFNQVGGKRMRGYFKDDKLSKMLIEGNAESIYFSRDSGKMTISGIQRSLSSRIGVDFKDNSATRLSFYTRPDNRYAPEAKYKEDEKILKGFIWKPKERPISKESIIPSFTKKADAAKAVADKAKKGKMPLKAPPGGKAVKDSINTVTGKLPGLKIGKDSVKANAVLPGIKVGKDSTIKANPATPGIKTGKDSSMKSNPVNQPVIKTGKDSTAVKPPTVKPI